MKKNCWGKKYKKVVYRKKKKCVEGSETLETYDKPIVRDSKGYVGMLPVLAALASGVCIMGTPDWGKFSLRAEKERLTETNKENLNSKL